MCSEWVPIKTYVCDITPQVKVQDAGSMRIANGPSVSTGTGNAFRSKLSSNRVRNSRMADHGATSEHTQPTCALHDLTSTIMTFRCYYTEDIGLFRLWINVFPRWDNQWNINNLQCGIKHGYFSIIMVTNAITVANHTIRIALFLNSLSVSHHYATFFAV
jgi:hypothetical protein